MSIEEHRKAIDKIDAEIVRLLNERTRHVLAIGKEKLQAGKEVYAPEREKAVLDRICSLNKGPLTNEALRAIYREIMSSALALEKMPVIAYFGPEATFTHMAAIHRFGSSVKYVPLHTVQDVFEEVERGRADYGVVPVENSTEGVVSSTLDMFVDSELKIVSEIILPIQHCLLSLSELKQIRVLYSHPQALGQCRNWIQRYLPHVEIIETSSTTRAAELAAQNKEAGAIASALAAQKYNLKILSRDIQDSKDNATRFLVLGRQIPPPTGSDRTSILLSVTDRVGALHSTLAPFKRHGINLTKIESRPSRRRAWTYYFFIDFEGHIEEEKVQKALKAVKRHCDLVKILGSYPKAQHSGTPPQALPNHMPSDTKENNDTG